MIRKIFFLICYFLLFRYYSHLEKGIVHHLKKTRFLSFRYDLFQVRSVWLGASSRKQHPKWLICFNRLSSYLRKGRNLSWLYEHTVYAWSCEQAWSRWMKLALWLLSERDIFFKKMWVYSMYYHYVVILFHWKNARSYIWSIFIFVIQECFVLVTSLFRNKYKCKKFTTTTNCEQQI